LAGEFNKLELALNQMNLVAPLNSMRETKGKPGPINGRASRWFHEPGVLLINSSSAQYTCDKSVLWEPNKWAGIAPG
jgi:hypothetical protein